MIHFLRLAGPAALLIPFLVAGDEPAELARGIASLQLDAQECYHVTALDIKKGPIAAHLGEGWLILSEPLKGASEPLKGARLGAIYISAAPVDATPQSTVAFSPSSSSERLALGNAVHKSELREPFHNAVMLFTDATEAELREQLLRQDAVRDAVRGAQVAREWGLAFAQVANGFHTRLVRDLIDANSRRGVFYLGVATTTLGSFDLFYDPAATEEAVAGHLRDGEFQIWAACCEPRRARPAATIDRYALDVRIAPDLLVSVVTKARLTVGADPTRSLPFAISRSMNVTGAKLDGVSVPVFQSMSLWSSALHEQGTKEFVAVAPARLQPGSVHEITIQHQGEVVVRGPGASLMVGARDAWYPRTSEGVADYRLTLRCAPELEVVASGKLLSEYLEGDTKVSQWQSDGQVRFASFNLGQFDRVTVHRDGLKAEVYFPSLREKPDGLPAETVNTTFTDPVNPAYARAAQLIGEEVWSAMRFMTSAFGALYSPALIVSPTPSPMAQNLSGHIFLPLSVYKSYSARPGEPEPALLGARFRREEAVAHEVAHEWWGNALRPATYHDEWIIEGLASYSALLYLRSIAGADGGAAEKAALAPQALATLRREVLELESNHKAAGAGPLWWGYRLQTLYGGSVWRKLTYQKGALVFAALNDSMGDARFDALLKKLFAQFRTKPIGTTELQALVAEYIPEPKVRAFFDAYVYGGSNLSGIKPERLL